MEITSNLFVCVSIYLYLYIYNICNHFTDAKNTSESHQEVNKAHGKPYCKIAEGKWAVTMRGK